MSDMIFKRLVFAVGFALSAASAEAGKFEKVLDWNGTEIEWTLEGGSFIKDGKLQERSKNIAVPPVPAGYEFRAYLLWSGETGHLDESTKRITLANSQGTREIKAQKIYSERSTGIIYTAVADVTDFLKKSRGPMVLSGLRSDAMDYARGNQFSQAGWTLFTVRRKGTAGPKKIRFFAGTEAVAPGEPFELPLWNEPKAARIMRLGVSGGHGIAGNAGGTLVNGKSVSGGDDWRGSSGELWDCHIYDLSKWQKKRAWTAAFDPLLEWIFPSCAIAEFLLY